MREILTVNNIKCGGCESMVRDGLSKIEGVDNINVDSTTGEVKFDYFVWGITFQLCFYHLRFFQNDVMLCWKKFYRLL